MNNETTKADHSSLPRIRSMGFYDDDVVEIKGTGLIGRIWGIPEREWAFVEVVEDGYLGVLAVDILLLEKLAEGRKNT